MAKYKVYAGLGDAKYIGTAEVASKEEAAKSLMNTPLRSMKATKKSIAPCWIIM